ncbi:hypothetical protein E2493_12275 [Sphingomonas parva]|uniref:Uncharacterized protein n=1 Tax=Sphingomonas parva TaxID=2555898 RepID=A0A4Y8ZU28_9SPHN|nr:hypothetical protein [Sphingomonas parva]TFI57966.1 hypothetical protein E2493_12275 [Sphingomonas parva]
MPLLESLDRFVHRTRLDILTPHAERRRRSFRWLPAASLAALLIGYALVAASTRGAVSPQAGFTGALAFVAGCTAATVLRLFGPRLDPDPAAALDEREIALKARAGSLSGAILLWGAMLFCFYAGYAAAVGAWIPANVTEWVLLGLGLQAAALALPVLVASWLQPRLDAEE